jgi:hypothetical protein
MELFRALSQSTWHEAKKLEMEFQMTVATAWHEPNCQRNHCSLAMKQFFGKDCCHGVSGPSMLVNVTSSQRPFQQRLTQ